jgi:hypothetical protein
MDIEYMGEAKTVDGRELFPQLLKAIKADQLSDPARREMWAKLKTYDNDGSARDAAHRLSGKHDEFEFIARRGDEGTTLYARLKEGVE